MLTDRVVIAHLGNFLLVLVVVGVFVRHQLATCRAFVALILSSLAGGHLTLLWPARFHVFSVYSIKETVYVVLELVMALEIWQRTFSAFPRARVRVGGLLIVALTLTAFAVWMIPTDPDPYTALISVLAPRQHAGSLTLFAIIVAAAWWHRIPLHPFHRAILLGLAGYLAQYVFLTSLIGLSQDEGSWVERLRPVDQWSFVAAAAWWAWAAWRPRREPDVTLTRLQPWARSW